MSVDGRRRHGWIYSVDVEGFIVWLNLNGR